jgi:molecular chaperone GrpE (heat shock protein)
MFPYTQTGTYNNDRTTYVRAMMPESPPLGVSQNTNNTDTITYNNYVNGGAISNEYGLAQATSVQQQQLSQLQTQLNLLTQQITTITSQYENGVNELESQSQENVSGLSGYLSQLINTNDNISSTTKMNSGNLQNILSDSDIIVLQKNYSYLVWSILAVGTVLITMNIVKK